VGETGGFTVKQPIEFEKSMCLGGFKSYKFYVLGFYKLYVFLNRLRCKKQPKNMEFVKQQIQREHFLP